MTDTPEQPDQIDPQSQVFEIIKDRLDAATVEIIRAAFQDAGRLSVIRDAFLEGKDAVAVKMIRDLDPTSGFRALLPTSANNALIAPGSSAQITARPQLPFSPMTLLVSHDCARLFDINEIRIGNRSILIQAGDVPAEIFAVDAPIFDLVPHEADTSGLHPLGVIKVQRGVDTMMPIRLDIGEVPVGTEITLTVTNARGVSDMGGLWRAAWYGTTSWR